MTTKITLTSGIIGLMSVAAYSVNADAKPLEFYGKVDVSVQSSEEGEGRFTEMKSNASKFGVKGDYALEDGLIIVYKLEWQVDVSDDSNEKNLKSRNQYIGLKGNFGEVRLGRHDTALKMSQGKADFFSDYEADVKTLWKGENRVNDSISYFSPIYAGFGMQLTYVVADAADADDALSAAIFYGDEGLKQSNIYAALAYDSEVNGYDTLRASAQFKLAEFTLSTMYQRQEDITTQLDRDGYLVGVAYPWQKLTLKTQYQVMDDDNGASVGVDYKLGKNSQIYAWYSSFNFDLAEDTDYLAVGLTHKF
ncbi:porin [Rheinheimera salexigens]|uniref:Porin n=1 Tax=Rheinheimera salexigens TaxID=1628148 RepID=A0A1E7Q3V5_9GAMM|nr:porin [Rheinheimera salexigens]OEY68728.1 porin [Rheinheimera salexigens]